MRRGGRAAVVFSSSLLFGAALALFPIVSANPTWTLPEYSGPDPSGPSQWTMPDLIGMDLEAAQDAIQSLTSGEVWYSGSTDLTGQGRAQVVDRDWVVCSSTPAPGGTFTPRTDLDFGVVRIDTETCL